MHCDFSLCSTHLPSSVSKRRNEDDGLINSQWIRAYLELPYFSILL